MIHIPNPLSCGALPLTLPSNHPLWITKLEVFVQNAAKNKASYPLPAL